MQDSMMELLGDPKYFTCEKTYCKLRVAVCVGRQKANEQREPFKQIAFPICENCDQGIRNRASYVPSEIDRKPRRGQGKRDNECYFYDECLGYAASRNWKSFNCESCLRVRKKGVMEERRAKEKKNERICETSDCGKVTLSTNCPYCASCMGSRAKAKREAKALVETVENGSGKTRGEAERWIVGEMGRPDEAEEVPKSGLSITINFSKHTQVLDQIRGLADEEIRPLDLQVIYMLKTYLISQGGQAREGN